MYRFSFLDQTGHYNTHGQIINDYVLQNSYLISLEGDPRKEYIAFRPRLKVFGTPVTTRSGIASESSLEGLNEAKPSVSDPKTNKTEGPQFKKDELKVGLQVNPSDARYELRPKRSNDFRKYY